MTLRKYSKHTPIISKSEVMTIITFLVASPFAIGRVTCMSLDALNYFIVTMFKNTYKNIFQMQFVIQILID
ncbi:hypothetical protein KU06062604_760028 [Flavobacterium psychrophilum]|nr:hypothetical protein KU06062604_760028 [Flavobacterium psychrophilum]